MFTLTSNTQYIVQILVLAKIKLNRLQALLAALIIEGTHRKVCKAKNIEFMVLNPFSRISSKIYSCFLAK